MRKDCGDAAETVWKDYGVVTMRKDCGDAAETVRKDYGSSADIVRTKCGATAVPLRRDVEVHSWATIGKASLVPRPRVPPCERVGSGDETKAWSHLYIASFPGAEEGEERAPGTHCMRMRLITTEFRGDRVRMCNVRILLTS